MPPYASRKYNRMRYRRRRSLAKSRRRFSKKRFTKRVPRGLKAGLYIPRQAYVKMPYTAIIYSPDITTGNYWTFGFNGNGITCPATIGPSPAAGEEYPLGLLQYASFYNYYKVLGASIKVQINNTAGAASTTAQGPAFCCLLAGQGELGASTNWSTYLTAETRDLIAYPGCSWKIMSQQTGSQSTIWLKNFRKTKSMLGRKDIRDNLDCQGMLPLISSGGINPSAPGENPRNSSLSGGSGSWFYMIRIDPALTTGDVPANTYQVIVKIKYYVQLYGRDFNIQAEAPEPPP